MGACSCQLSVISSQLFEETVHAASPHLASSSWIGSRILAGLRRTPSTQAAGSRAQDFEVQKIGEGVYAVIRTYPPGLMVDGNSAFIVGEDDVMVVDAPESSREILEAIRKLTPKPVRYVINTHWHDDHITGNQVYRDAFPGVEIVGHAKTREYLPTTGVANRQKMLEGAPKVVARIAHFSRRTRASPGRS